MINWFQVVKASTESEPAVILIYGRIGRTYDDLGKPLGIGAEDFADKLREIPLAQSLRVRINSDGGNDEDAMTIYSLLRERPMVECRVDGVANGAAALVACAGKTLVMSTVARLGLALPEAVCWGEAKDFRACAVRLEGLTDSWANAFAAKSGASPSEARSWMEARANLSASEAAERGLADVVA